MSDIIGIAFIIGLAALAIYFGVSVGKEICAKVKQAKENKKDK